MRSNNFDDNLLLTARKLLADVRADGWHVQPGESDVPLIFAPRHFMSDPRMHWLLTHPATVAAVLRQETH